MAQIMHQSGHEEVTLMRPFLPGLIAFGLLCAATRAPAACRWFGTQLECDLGGNQVLIGTQTEDEPAYLRPFRPTGLHGGGALLPDRVAPDRPFRFELQNVRPHPSLRREIGGEAYGY